MITQNELFTLDQECCGCGSCANVCPKSVLSMQADSSGFLYPRITNPTACIDCKLCTKVCPEKNYTDIKSEFRSSFAGYLEDDGDLISCASGGLATAISRKFINEGGIVYGCTYSDDWKSIVYNRADTIEILEKFKTSKYAQSIKNGVYKEVLADLYTGHRVLFIGLPCDVLAMKNLSPKEHIDDLYLLELICHGPTSQKVHQQYIKSLEDNNGKITYFSAREKKDGNWKPFYIKAKFENGGEYLKEFHKSSYGIAFRFLKRPSCYSCKIKGSHLAGDLMIGDYHYVEKGMRGFNSHGVSSALVHNDKGEYLLKGLEHFGFKIIDIPMKNAIGNAAITKAIKKPDRQKEFEQVYNSKGLDAACRLGFVVKTNTKRAFWMKITRVAVLIKRALIPSSRPNA